MGKKILILLLVAILTLSLSVSVASASDKPITPPSLKQVILIHYAQPDGAPGKPGGSSSAPKVYTNYKLLGPRWLTLPVSYVIDPDYGPAGAAAQVYNAFETWDAATSAELYNDSYTVDSIASPSLGAADFKNVVSWRLLAGYPNAIALTSFWYDDKTGDGLSLDDEMLDTDIIFNLKFKWGVDPDGEGSLTLPKGYYDVRNIATHEAGHVTGLADLYDKADSEMTMYGYSAARETKKISLEIGDISGAQALYGQ